MPGWQEQVLAATAAVCVKAGAPPIGTAVLIEPRRLLTCRHVVTADGTPDGQLLDRVTVTFPGRRSWGAKPLFSVSGVDAAVVELIAPIDGENEAGQALPVPVQLSGSARRPPRVELIGYPAKDRTEDGVWRSYRVTGPTASGHAQLSWDDAGSLPGHSGGPVVDARSGQLVGLLREGSEVGRFDRYVPLTLMYERGLLSRLPWLMEGDDAAGHVTRRAAGARAVATGRDLFRGRDAALARTDEWLGSIKHPGQVLVVTGQPGAGKSAVISRAALKAAEKREGDRRWRGLVFHARAATTAAFRTAVADLTGAHEDNTPSELLASFDAIGEADPTTRWVIIVDALDEAVSRDDRIKIAGLLVQLAARPWVRAAVATRPLSPAGPYSPGSLLRRLDVGGPNAPNLIDLDVDRYFHQVDLVRFIEDLLTQRGERYPAPPGGAWQTYRDDAALTHRLASVIAERSRRNFLVAALTSVPLSRESDVRDADPGLDVERLPASVGEALDRYLDAHPHRHRLRGVLTALAYAEGSGLDDSTWRLLSEALGYPCDQADLDELRASPVADYLLQSTSEPEGTVTRLFHQALVDQLLAPRDRRQDQAALVAALLDDVRRSGGWPAARPYLLGHLANHADQAGQLVDVLRDPEYILHADLRVLNSLARQLPARRRPDTAWLILQAGPAAHPLAPDERAGLLAVTAAHLGLAQQSREFIDRADTAVNPRWAHTLGVIHTRLTAHPGGVTAVAAVPMPDGRVLLASAGSTRAGPVGPSPPDGTIQLWDAGTCEPVGGPLTRYTGWVHALAAVRVPDGRVALVSAGTDGTVQLWDPGSRQPAGPPLTGHTAAVEAMAPVQLPDGRVLLASAGEDRTLRLWDPGTGQPVAALETGQAHGIFAIAAVPVPDARVLLATAGGDTVRLWDAVTGRPAGALTGHDAWVRRLTAVPMPDGRVLLACADTDGTLRLWDPGTSSPVAALETGHTYGVQAVTAALMPDRRVLLATAGDVTVRLWDPGTGQPVGAPLTGHTAAVEAVATVPMPDGRMLLASASDDGTVRLWDPSAAQPVGEPLRGHTGSVAAVAVVPAPQGHALLASAGDDGTVRIWQPDTGQPAAAPLIGQTSAIAAVTAVSMPDGQSLLAEGGVGGTVRLWTVPTGERVGSLTAHDGVVRALAWVALSDGRELLASAGDVTVRLWDPRTGQPVGAALTGHSQVLSLAAVPTPDGRVLLASAGEDRTVRLWDPGTGQPVGAPLTGHTGWIRSLAVAALPDGPVLLASGGDDGTVRLWDPGTGQAVGDPLTGHAGPVWAVATLPMPDGRVLLASAGEDSAVRVWDPVTRQLVGRPLMMVEPVVSMVGFDGRLAVATGLAVCLLARPADAMC
jgi:WD40 repeat protein